MGHRFGEVAVAPAGLAGDDAQVGHSRSGANGHEVGNDNDENGERHHWRRPIRRRTSQNIQRRP